MVCPFVFNISHFKLLLCSEEKNPEKVLMQSRSAKHLTSTSLISFLSSSEELSVRYILLFHLQTFFSLLVK
jgi:hypothetical protein